LEYLLKNNYVYFQPDTIAKALGIDNRRAWDIVQRFVNRGIAYRTGVRGQYILDRDKAAIIISMKKSIHSKKKGKSKPKESDVSLGSLKFSGRRMCRRVRVHSRSSDVIEFLRGVVFARIFLSYAYYDLYHYLLRLGFSRSAVRRIIREAIGIAERFMQRAVPSFGVHGVSRYRANGGDITLNLGSKEIGFDFVSDIPIPKFHIKIYSDDGGKRPLIEFSI